MPRLDPFVLLVNLGTPAAPTAGALRRYLREFLWDRRVVEQPRLKWWLILHLFVLTTRPRKSAALYRKIWTPEGSPLLVHSRRIAAALEGELARPVGLAMRYGEPSIRSAVERLAHEGFTKLLCLPLYPQYSGPTAASTFDALTTELRRLRAIPSLRTIHDYHDDPGYLDALAASIREQRATGPVSDCLVFSFHGLPQRSADEGDPYPEQCRRTAVLVAERLGLPPDAWVVAYQSRFGRDPWLEPSTQELVPRLVAEGRTVDVVCPGFAADCLETLEEIGQLDKDCRRLTGRGLRYLPCLNDRPDHVQALAGLIRRHLEGWESVAPRD